MKAGIVGCFHAIVTPFKEEGLRYDHPINYDALDPYMDRLIKGGCDGVVVCGSTGSDSVLSHDEQVNLAKYVQEHFGKMTKIIAGDGSNWTKEAIELAQRMEKEAKIYTHLSICPYKNKPSDRGLTDHYTAIADNTEGEHILYSVKSRTGGKGILPHVVQRLAEHPRIIAIKEADGSLEKVRKIIEMTKGMDFLVTSGEDAQNLEMIKLGAKGTISVAAGPDPYRVSSMIHHALRGEYEIAEKLDRELGPLYEALFPTSKDTNPSPNPVLCHYALRKIGIPVGVSRLPLTDAEPQEKEYMDKVLAELKLI